MHKILLTRPFHLSGLAGSNGERHRNPGPTAQLALHRQAAAMLLHDLLHEAKANARAGDRVSIAATKETFMDPLQFARGDTDAMIGDANIDVIIGRFAGNLDEAAFRRIFYRVRYE